MAPKSATATDRVSVYVSPRSRTVYTGGSGIRCIDARATIPITAKTMVADTKLGKAKGVIAQFTIKLCDAFSFTRVFRSISV